MAENYYEGMFLLDSGKFATDPDGVAKQVLDILGKASGTIVAHRPWQDGKLAYPVNGHRKGLHYLTYFTMEGDHLRDVTRACKLNDLIIRHLVIKQPKVLFDKMVAALEHYESGATSNQDEDTDTETDTDDEDESGDDD